METKGNRGIAPCILNLDTGCRRVSASYLGAKSPWYPLDRRQGVPQRISERRGVGLLITVLSPRAQPTATRISGFNDDSSTNSVKLVVSKLIKEFLATYSKRKIKLSLCLTNSALCHEDVLVNGCIDPRILDLDTSCG
jgi:hypothetical protein